MNTQSLTGQIQRGGAPIPLADLPGFPANAEQLEVKSLLKAYGPWTAGTKVRAAFASTAGFKRFILSIGWSLIPFLCGAQGLLIEGSLEKAGGGRTNQFRSTIYYEETNQWATTLQRSGDDRGRWNGVPVTTWTQNGEVHEFRESANKGKTLPTDKLHSGNLPVRGMGHSLQLWLTIAIPNMNREHDGASTLPAPWSGWESSPVEQAAYTISETSPDVIKVKYWDEDYENCSPAAGDDARPRAAVILEDLNRKSGVLIPRQSRIYLFRYDGRNNEFETEVSASYTMNVSSVRPGKREEIVPEFKEIAPIAVDDYRVQDRLEGTNSVSYVVSNNWLKLDDPRLSKIIERQNSMERRTSGTSGSGELMISLAIFVIIAGLPALTLLWRLRAKSKQASSGREKGL